MRATEVIRRKRDGEALDAEMIEAAVAGIASGAWSEGQVAAFAMATWLRGMSGPECVALTRAMAASGERLDWSDLGRPCIDKHSTGGVGDKVSIVLAPLLAACGVCVPMISGRGLGHTGGTLDKLESIPGIRCDVEPAELCHIVSTAGCAIVGASERLAPADQRLYAVRDVTATVESQPLIVASILSKKLAAGVDALVMDVKTGSGAFLPELDDARELAKALVEVANDAGLPTTAFVTDMGSVLGHAAGNALEIGESIAYLTGRAVDSRLDTVVFALGREMLEQAGHEPREATVMLRAALDDGRAAERFGAMVRAQGGPADLLERPGRYLPVAPVVRPVTSTAGGWIEALDVRALGEAIVDLGGGRSRPGAGIDLAVGLEQVRAVGEKVEPGAPLAVVHARDPDAAERAVAAVSGAFTLVGSETAVRPMVWERIG